MDPKWIGIIAALGSAACWAIGAILFKRLGEKLDSSAMTLAKQIVSVLLLASALALVGFHRLETPSMVLLVLSGLLGIALGDTFFFEALRDLGPFGVILLLTTGQVLTVVLAVLVLGDAPAATVWGGMLLVLGGVAVVMVGKLSGGAQPSRWRGIAFGLAAVVCMSVSLIVAKPGLGSVSALQATFIRMLAGAAGMLAFGLATRRLGHWMTPFRSRKLAAEFVGAVLVVTFGGFWLSLVAIKYVDVSIANTLNSTEPVFALPLTALFLKERITWTALAGTAATVAGIVLMCGT